MRLSQVERISVRRSSRPDPRPADPPSRGISAKRPACRPRCARIPRRLPASTGFRGDNRPGQDPAATTGMLSSSCARFRLWRWSRHTWRSFRQMPGSRLVPTARTSGFRGSGRSPSLCRMQAPS